MVFLIVFTCSAVGQEIIKRQDGAYSTRELKDRAPISSNNRVLIRSVEALSGEMRIEASEQNVVGVSYIKIARCESRSKAVDVIDLISVAFSAKPDQLLLDLHVPSPPPWDSDREYGKVELVVTVPFDCFVTIEAQHFDIEAQGPLRGLVVPSSYHTISAIGITEQLSLSTTNQRVNLDSISGEISVSTSNSSIMARAISGTTVPAKFRNDGGDIRINSFAGSINVKNRQGRISIFDFRPEGKSNVIRGLAGPIILEINSMSSGQLVVNNRDEDIEIVIPDSLQAFLSLAVSEGNSIEAAGFPFQTDLVQRNRLNLVSGDGLVEIRGAVRGQGNIYVRGERGD
jgi:hypothetical protein